MDAQQATSFSKCPLPGDEASEGGKAHWSDGGSSNKSGNSIKSASGSIKSGSGSIKSSDIASSGIQKRPYSAGPRHVVSTSRSVQSKDSSDSLGRRIRDDLDELISNPSSVKSAGRASPFSSGQCILTPAQQDTSGYQSQANIADEATQAGMSSSIPIGQYSVGDALHDVGGCKPCLFVHTHVGCQNGASCEFCHYVHIRKNKPRPCKGKRERYRKLLNSMQQSIDDRDDAENIKCLPDNTGEST